MKISGFDEFRRLSAQLGQDPFQVQGAGGNTSIKNDGVMWIKASGTELANAEDADIFVAVDLDAARKEASGDGDGSCKNAVLDRQLDLRPSIETTFHAVLDWPVVAHTHSIATLVHAISPEGREQAQAKLVGQPYVVVPYAKPGLPLTREIVARVRPETRIIVLENHGLICCGETVSQTAELINEVEERLSMPAAPSEFKPLSHPPAGFLWAEESWMAGNARALELIAAGSYYPDHVVFLGPSLPISDHDGKPPAIIRKGEGVIIREDATPSQKAMLRCISDILSRFPFDWSAEPIGQHSEAELLDWDAEKYRQALAARE